ncbi:MAG TPA: hemolysin III family protein [Clostridiales bacterium]|nr:hemolysin III family protein [Clostridiales bacterium]
MDFLKRKYTLGEEVFNAISHGTGALLSIAGTVVLIIFCAIYADSRAVATASIYGACLILLYTMSTLYHAISNEKAKKIFRILDHNTIFLMIAGTYTPYTISCLNNKTGWILFGCIWGSAIIGIVLSSINIKKFSKVSTLCYLIMGWAVIFAIKPLYETISTLSLILLLAGGLFYSIGIIFYVKRELKYMHSVWHLFVIGGSIMHYFSIFLALVEV